MRFRVVTRNNAKCVMLRNPGGSVKNNRAKPRDDTHQRRQPQESDLGTKSLSTEA